MHKAVVTLTSIKLPSYTQGYNSAIEFIIIGLSRHEKDLVFWF